ncbi:HPr family phosphocarrier protein [Alicyclobacillus fastidiosus]|uniref:HPr family phosphocarrier protein n=1 Tax=Alicyclobacillus fastidiosus TaxID=392011 RepID=A0ABY6ZRI9_9BACL|nr:HPr family phosphocarrier protein [Alicyclobacillus fastidiosus]WAH44741.1 HPr family phosphocarrier protein [Alicyclobacillus fastidiosus]
MVEKEVVVKIQGGLFARAAANFVQAANRFRAEVTLEKDGKSVNAKSIMGVMSLAVASGQTVVVRANGGDEQQAVEQLVEFIQTEHLS